MCGVAGAIGIPNAAVSVRMMMHGQQNRGERACGILSIDNTIKHHERFFGTVSDNFDDEVLTRLPGDLAIGHNRYPTAGDRTKKDLASIQPLAFRHHRQVLAIGHNGNFTNKEELEDSDLREVAWKTELDTEAFLQLIIKENANTDLIESVKTVMMKMRGSCSAVIARPRELIAVCDPYANRPLIWARKDRGFVVASESSALGAIGVLHSEMCEVEPGEIISFSANGMRKEKVNFGNTHCQHCIFEPIYFGNPHSRQRGLKIKDFRRALGAEIARQFPIEADVIVGVPDSALLHAQGYASVAKHIPLDNEIINRRHNTGRSFTQPGQAKREKVAEEKSSYDSEEIDGKSILLVDDSIVRGTTMRKIVAALRARGAKAIHVVIMAPQIIKPCHTGIDTPTEEELIASHKSVDEICLEIGADSLGFGSVEILRTVVESFDLDFENFCKACFDGSYWHDLPPGIPTQE